MVGQTHSAVLDEDHSSLWGIRVSKEIQQFNLLRYFLWVSMSAPLGEALLFWPLPQG